MMYRINRSLIFVVAASVMMAASCKNKEEDSLPVEEFDRQGMLKNYGNNIILPNYERLNNSLDTLVDLTVTFTATPNQINIDNLRQAFKSSWKNWMHCSSFEFGPASNNILRQTMNTFPADTAQINSNISSGSYSLATAANIDAAGFPSMDFLLYGVGTNDTEILDAYTITNNYLNRKQYLLDVVNYLKSNVNTVYVAWTSSGGNYINTFLSATGTDVNSSTGLMVNDLNFDFEILKNFRIGIPLGKQTLDIPLPEKVESLYGKFSSELAREHIRAVENIYLGRDRNGVDGSGLDEYLSFVGANYNGSPLNGVIQTRLAEAKTALDNMPNDLGDAVVNNASPVDNAYQKLVQLLVLLKTDLPSSLGILITYQDNDGD